MECVRIIDPEEVNNCKRRRLQRRKYVTTGPNFLWHMDGLDKLKPFGFCFHGAVDGFSRRILWLNVGSTNKNPRVVANYFLNTVDQLEGVSRMIRYDNGTETTIVSLLQQYFR